MKLGCCTSADHISQLQQAGISCIELNANGVEALSDQKFEELQLTLEQCKNVKAFSANCMFPGSVPPLFTDHELTETKAYLQKLLPRLGKLGIKYLVFGSGSYRKAPEGLSSEEIKKTVSTFLTVLCDMASKEAISIVIEPLNRNETNIINTTDEAVEYIHALNLPNLFLLVDLYHFELEQENLDKLSGYGSILRHVHIANPEGRGVPTLEDNYDYTKFFQLLTQIGYNGIVSLEYNSQSGMLEKELQKASDLFYNKIK